MDLARRTQLGPGGRRAANSYSCACAAGYEDTHCGTDIDECFSSPCLNAGTCTESIDSYDDSQVSSRHTDRPMEVQLSAVEGLCKIGNG